MVVAAVVVVGGVAGGGGGGVSKSSTTASKARTTQAKMHTVFLMMAYIFLSIKPSITPIYTQDRTDMVLLLCGFRPGLPSNAGENITQRVHVPNYEVLELAVIVICGNGFG